MVLKISTSCLFKLRAKYIEKTDDVQTIKANDIETNMAVDIETNTTKVADQLEVRKKKFFQISF